MGVWNVTGPKAVVSSTTKPKHSLSGSMKKISSESFPCKREVMYEVYSKDWPEVLRLYKTPSRKVLMPLRPDAKSFPFNPVEPVVNLVDKLDTLMTFPTSIVLDTPKLVLSKP